MTDTYLVTGCAGFIGFHLTLTLLKRGHSVVGVDNLNNYYSTNLKTDRLQLIKSSSTNNAFTFYNCDIRSYDSLSPIFELHKPAYVYNLAAQAGVRHSLTHPWDYTSNNIDGFLNVLECCRHYDVAHLLYASSSSVYGGITRQPLSETAVINRPLSLYAATKIGNEMMASSYSHLYNIKATGLRFFTAYGPWGRPDMALFIFTRNILQNLPIDVYNNGDMYRDFTYVSDIIESVIALTNNHLLLSHEVINIGGSVSVRLLDFVHCLEDVLGTRAKINFLPIQPGDVTATQADNSRLASLIDLPKFTSISTGIPNFVHWYRNYYND